MKKYFLSSLCLTITSLLSLQLQANCLPPEEAIFQISHIEGKGIGYHKGYTSFKELLYLPCYTHPDFLPFIDLRAHVFDNGKPAVNAGLGTRYLCGDNVWGANLYYDYRKEHHHNYHQIGVGTEFLGCCYDLRFNAYFPFIHTKTHKYNYHFAGFQGHHALISHQQKFAMTGADAEIGTTLIDYSPLSLSLYGAAGPYYYGDSARDTWGGKARAILNCFDYLSLEVNGSYDHLFKGIVQGMISLNIPLGPYQPCCRTCSPKIMQPVQRQEIIVIDHKKSKKPAIDPRTGRPYQFVFVDNTSTNSQGSFEAPYATLKEAQNNSQPGNKIYLFPGDGSVRGMDQGIVLKNRQVLWGASVSHLLSTTQGRFVIPPHAVDMPTISNPLGNGVTLANDNEVSGIHITNSTNAIFGKKITNGNINRNLFTLTQLVPASLNQPVVIERFDDTLLLNGPAYIKIVDPKGTFTVRDNHLTANAQTGVQLTGIFTYDEDQKNLHNQSLFTIENNVMEGLGNAIQIINLHKANYVIQNNQFFNTFVEVTNGNVFCGNEKTGTMNILFAANNFVNVPDTIGITTIDQAQTTVAIRDNDLLVTVPLLEVHFGSLFFKNLNNGLCDIEVSNNRIQHTLFTDITYYGKDNSTATLRVFNNHTVLGNALGFFNIAEVRCNANTRLDCTFTNNFADATAVADQTLMNGWFFSYATTQDGSIVFDNNRDLVQPVGVSQAFSLDISHNGDGKLTTLIQNNDFGSISSGTRNEVADTGELDVCFSNNKGPAYPISNFSSTARLNLEQHGNSKPPKLTGTIHEVTSGICPN